MAVTGSTAWSQRINKLDDDSRLLRSPDLSKQPLACHTQFVARRRALSSTIISSQGLQKADEVYKKRPSPSVKKCDC